METVDCDDWPIQEQDQAVAASSMGQGQTTATLNACINRKPSVASSPLSIIARRPTICETWTKSPADSAVTHVDVLARAASSPEPEDLTAGSLDARSSTHTAQSVRSADGNFRALWEEASASDSSSDASVAENGDTTQATISEHDATSESAATPMERVKRKLAAWSWNRDDTEDDDEADNPTLRLQGFPGRRCPSGEEGMPAPPNTEYSSVAPSRRHSIPHGQSAALKLNTQPESGQGRTPFVKSSPATPTIGYPSCEDSSISNLSRQMSASALQDPWFRTHRDSVALTHRRLDDKRGAINAQLATTQDSVVLTRSRFEKYPRSRVLTDAHTGKITFGGLSPIMDASPPDPRTHYGSVQRASPAKASLEHARGSTSRESIDALVVEKPAESSVEVAGHADKDDGCPICQMERPRSCMAASMKGAW